MNKKESTSIENSSEIKEEKNLNYTKFWAWGFGLIIVLMGLAYLAGYITFGTTPAVKESDKKAYFEQDSTTAAAAATDVRMDSVKAKQ